MDFPYVIVVEDESELADLVAHYLRGHQFRIDIAPNAERALEMLELEDPSAYIVDVRLPGIDGFELCRRLRERGYDGAILMLTARTEVVDEVKGLELGADDYLTKPVRPRVLVARLRKALGQRHPTSRRVCVGTLAIDATRREVTQHESLVELTTAEFDLLWALARRVGEVVTREELFSAAGRSVYDARDRSIDLRVSRLRKKLGDDPNRPDLIKSVRGVGYMLAGPR